MQLPVPNPISCRVHCQKYNALANYCTHFALPDMHYTILIREEVVYPLHIVHVRFHSKRI